MSTSQKVCQLTHTPYGFQVTDSEAVPRTNFLIAMADYWEDHLSNVGSRKLREAWAQLCDAFNGRIAAYGTPEAATCWDVIPAMTGVGKTQGTAVYCAMLPEDSHPGVLIVTKMIEEADKLASTINELSDSTVAMAYHSKTPKRDRDRVKEHPVLVVTHEAYRAALTAAEVVSREAGEWPLEFIDRPKSWGALTNWIEGPRKLVVIDEALELVLDATVTVDDLRDAFIPYHIGVKHQRAMEGIAAVKQVLEDIAAVKQEKESHKERIIRRDGIDGRLDLGPLRDDLRTYFYSPKAAGGAPEVVRDYRGERTDEILLRVEHLYNSWQLYSRQGLDHTISTAQLLVPKDAQGAVVLDATARINPVYGLFERAKVWPRVEGCRSYQRVTLHVSRGHSVGKNATLKDLKVRCRHLVETIKKESEGKPGDVFVVTHKAAEDYLIRTRALEPWMKPGHHWAVTGRNDWKDCRAIYIQSLPYLPDLASALQFFAYQGVQTDEWLGKRGDRPFGSHRDIRHAIRVGAVAAEVVQEINRIRCRNVIDKDGNCQSADAYLPLPDGEIGDEILALIKEEMPGIVIQDWEFSGAKKRKRVSKYERVLLRRLEDLHGQAYCTDLQQELKIPERCFKQLVSSRANAVSNLSQLMARRGIHYVKGCGRGSRSYFTSAA